MSVHAIVVIVQYTEILHRKHMDCETGTDSAKCSPSMQENTPQIIHFAKILWLGVRGVGGMGGDMPHEPPSRGILHSSHLRWPMWELGNPFPPQILDLPLEACGTASPSCPLSPVERINYVL